VPQASKETPQQRLEKAVAFLRRKDLGLDTRTLRAVDLLEKLRRGGPRQSHGRMLGGAPFHFKSPAVEEHGPLQVPVFYNPQGDDFRLADLVPQNFVPPHQNESALDDPARRAF